MDVLSDLLFDYTLRTVALGSAALGVVSGAVGAFAVLRRQALLGDAMSHAALPGVALAFLITGSRTPLVLMVGAALAGWVAALAVIGIIRASRVKADAAMALILSVFFGAGLVVLTFIQRQSAAGKAGLDRYLFGQAAALLEVDVITMAAVGAVAVLIAAGALEGIQAPELQSRLRRLAGLSPFAGWTCCSRACSSSPSWWDSRRSAWC